MVDFSPSMEGSITGNGGGGTAKQIVGNRNNVIYNEISLKMCLLMFSSMMIVNKKDHFSCFGVGKRWHKVKCSHLVALGIGCGHKFEGFVGIHLSEPSR